MKKFKSGFTLAELLTTVGVIGFMLVILLPVLQRAIPNKPLVMFKKTYYITERVVSELINDDDCYWESSEEDAKPYLGNVDAVDNKKDSNDVVAENEAKFCVLFGHKLNLVSKMDCTAKTFTKGVAPEGNFTTADNVTYLIPLSKFEEADKPEEIKIDVNGEKGPNCFYTDGECIAPDRFVIKIYQSGRLEVTGKREVQYLQSASTTKTAQDFDEEDND